jgi:hypothetical protein
VEFQGAARCGCDVTSLYPQTSRQNRRKALQQILQSLLQMMFAARAAKTAGVNRKSYVIQTPLTFKWTKFGDQILAFGDAPTTEHARYYAANLDSRD